ncbi:DUF485 domain-containing protein [Falsarthrobacter nasiphocae]|uniref:Uncharacterized membrane protein (DUF485 family) n=1 Tax=Falsarthrobacter nasiphocae TaxID=189863 RepID=A0AAE3YI33_9MICC|nr:DUF485 domain-containing protein [Falsarthrobacter nasiphocae]MDR6892610.1 uncharacterized membrane protein (DUF485 family) [Falsarthrobacter nasiphocae]
MHQPRADERRLDSYEAVQDSAPFRELKSRHRRFVFPLAIAFLVWYFAYVILAAYAHSFMSIKVMGNINIGLVFGLLQFVSTFVITAMYVRFANRTMDPLGEEIRADYADATGPALGSADKEDRA